MNPVSAIGNTNMDLPRIAANPAEDGGFNELFNQMIEQQAIGSAAGMPAGGADMQSVMMSNIMNSAANGEVNDTQIALFLLCMMMSSDTGGDKSMLMSVLSSAISKMDEPSANDLRQQVMTSDYTPYVKDTVDNRVFNNPLPTADVPKSGSSAPILPSEAWRPVTPADVNLPGQRSAAALRSIIDQFDVENSYRYQPYKNGSDTYCNIFVWDVSRALGAEIPHYVDPETGAPRSYPNIKGATEMNANGIYKWLAGHGADYGWREVSAKEAQQYANQGYPAVTAWHNDTGRSGHVQIVCPSRDGGFDTVRGVTVAQAGRNNYSYKNISSTFSSKQLPGVKYYVHS